MKKTALQECILEIDAKLDFSNGKEFIDLPIHQRCFYDAYINVKKILQSKLEKEKQDLIEAFKEGYIERELEDLDMDEYADFEDYYKQNFKTIT